MIIFVGHSLPLTTFSTAIAGSGVCERLVQFAFFVTRIYICPQQILVVSNVRNIALNQPDSRVFIFVESGFFITPSVGADVRVSLHHIPLLVRQLHLFYSPTSVFSLKTRSQQLHTNKKFLTPAKWRSLSLSLCSVRESEINTRGCQSFVCFQ